jgi:hypothetical protein
VPASAISQALLDRLGFGLRRCRVDQIGCASRQLSHHVGMMALECLRADAHGHPSAAAHNL